MSVGTEIDGCRSNLVGVRYLIKRAIDINDYSNLLWEIQGYWGFSGGVDIHNISRWNDNAEL